jgi:hypothetical protein
VSQTAPLPERCAAGSNYAKSDRNLVGVIEAPGGREEDTEDTGGSYGPPWWIRPYRDPVSGAAVKKQMSLPFDLLLGRKNACSG